METNMNTFSKLSIASALMLSTAFGVASAQQANEPDPAPPAAQCEDGDGPDCDNDMAGNDDRRMGRHGGRHGDGEGRHSMGGRHGGGRGMQIFDANNDGVIGEDEAASMAERGFMRMDRDRDGKVTEAEFTAGPHGKRGGWFNWNSDEQAAVEKVRKDKFATLDVNKDASLDKAEFFADAKAKLAAADADKDGKVSPWEFRASR
jgi:EF hand